MPNSRAARDRRLAERAGRQWGVVDHDHLVQLGFSGSSIHRAIQAGRLHRRYHSVYSVGHTAIGREGRWLAAVLACGPGGFLALRAAGALLDLRPSSRARIDVTTSRRGRRAPPGIDLHETVRLGAHEVTTHLGIPVTTVSRTLADLAGVLRGRDLERTFERAEALQLLDVPSVLASVAHRPGAVAVRRILAAWEPAATRSELEVALLQLVLGSDLPPPEVNVKIGELEVDLLWRAGRLVAEADSVQFHLTRAAMERDRRRDAVLARQGFRVLRFTHRQVDHRPREVLGALAAALM